jgi:hypothetical protein
MFSVLLHIAVPVFRLDIFEGNLEAVTSGHRHKAEGESWWMKQKSHVLC